MDSKATVAYHLAFHCGVVNVRAALVCRRYAASEEPSRDERRDGSEGEQAAAEVSWTGV
jgi:hypothetical protein